MKLDVAERHVEFTIFIETMMKSSLLSISFHAITRHDFIKRWIVIIHFNDIAMINFVKGFTDRHEQLVFSSSEVEALIKQLLSETHFVLKFTFKLCLFNTRPGSI